jgi:hypothetical protein
MRKSNDSRFRSFPWMASRTEMYRRRAVECIEQAELAKNRSVRQTFLELASHWNELADRTEIEDAEDSLPDTGH